MTIAVIDEIADMGALNAPARAAHFNGGQFACFDVFQESFAGFDAEIELYLG